MHRLSVKLLASLTFVFIHLGLVLALAAEPFPIYEEIQPNVSFWKKVYTEYPTTRAIVHDSTDLGIVYEVIVLKPHDAPGARKINRKRMKRARVKYQSLLKRLAADPRTGNSEARRVAALFGPGAGAREFRRASSRVRCQIGQKNRFMAGLTRSGAYIDEIRTILKSYGVPEDLAYLPHVESSFNPKAYSKFGAAGIWQFTRSTGRRFMTVGYEVDERRDPIRATHAAARLLKENHDRLGSWPLAITAYNHGASGLARAKRKHDDYPAIFRSYRSRTFKFASRNFYSEFLAARQVAANPHQYFDALPTDQPTPFHTVVLAGYARFEDLSAHFKIAPAALKAVNPALRSPVINGQKHVPKGYHLRLTMAAGNDSELAVIPPTLYLASQKRSRFYTVQRGDTAGKIARANRVRLADLIAANNLNRRATIYPRQTLRIPLPDETVAAKPPPLPLSTPTLVADRGAASRPRPQTAVRPPKPQSPPEPPVVSEPQAPIPVEMPRPMLASVVPLPSPERAEEKVAKTPATARQAPSAEIVAADVLFERIMAIKGQPVGILQVEVEETLGHYAEWAGVRTQAIRRLNGLPYGRTLHLHQKVKIPLHRTTEALFEENRYEFHKRLQEDFFAVYRVGELDAYRVRRGDSYWALCREKFDIPLWLLKHYNAEIDLADLRIRQKLIIPVIEKTDAGDPGTVTPDDVAEIPAED
ncbi:MAG: transglycosylase SLT domain-containing protein [Desulfosarcina sp.]|nr:transglycosylase SLT domain-containing protein [Desulfobacterales bacterium]